MSININSHEKNPCTLNEIIYNGKKVFITFHSNNRKMTPNVTMNDLKNKRTN